MTVVKMQDAAAAKKAGVLAALLWPDNTAAEMQSEMEQLLHSSTDAVFIAMDGEESVGFAHCSLRSGYVEGTSTSPVGYLEGIYVKESARGRGAAKKLVAAAEDFARSKGCTEFASDCELQNTESLGFHLKLGFTEENRIICFAKKL